MPLFIVVLLRTSYNKETKERRKTRDEKTREVKVEIKRRLRPILHQTQLLKRIKVKYLSLCNNYTNTVYTLNNEKITTFASLGLCRKKTIYKVNCDKNFEIEFMLLLCIKKKL